MKELHEVVALVKKLSEENGRTVSRDELVAAGIPDSTIRRHGGHQKILDAAGLHSRKFDRNAVDHQGARVLIFDIETKPMLCWVWNVWGEQNIGNDQIVEDWSVLSWAAKWLGDKKVMYQDQRENAPSNLMDDKKLVEGIWKLLNEADVVITQNGKKFDVKKLNARFLKHKMPPPSSYRHIDTKEIAKRLYALTRNSLDYMTRELNEVFKKLDHANFVGFKLWLQCMAGNPLAWREMKKYNVHDVLALEELYIRMRPWIKDVNFAVYEDDIINRCTCGSTEFASRGYRYTNAGKYRRLACKTCGCEYAEKQNLLSKEKRDSLIKT